MPNAKFSLPPEEYRARCDRTRDLLRQNGYSGLLAFSGYGERDGNVCYLCGHKNAFPYSVRTDQVSGLGYSAFLLPLEGKSTLIATLGFQANAVVGVENAKTGTNFTRDLIDSINETPLHEPKLAVAGADIIPAFYMEQLRREFQAVTFDYNEAILTNQRLVKSGNELRLLRNASKIADVAMSAAMKAVKPGVRESDIGSVARKAAMQAGADYVVRDRVQSGKQMGQLRWPFASSKKVRRGELVSVDFVGWVDAYGFDILRIGCAGRPNKRQRKLIETAAQATEAMSDQLIDGVKIESSVSALQRFERDGFKVSAFGHGIGLEIVENPYLFPGVPGEIRRNMVLCVEPDVRLKGNFASIENEIIVTDRKPEVLTKLPVFWD